jgi:hydrogenase maturation protease
LRKSVIGIGNLLRADDGVGIHVVRLLEEKMPEVETVDLSTANIDLLDHIRGREKVVIVDAMRSGADPGTILRLVPEELVETDFSQSHGLNFPAILQLGRRLYPEEMPEKIVILVVEAEDTESFSSELTPEVRSSLPELIEKIKGELA